VSSVLAVVFGMAGAFLSRAPLRWVALAGAIVSPFISAAALYVLLVTEAMAIVLWWWWSIVTLAVVCYLTVAAVDVITLVRARGPRSIDP
jgi:hypothetical protein